MTTNGSDALRVLAINAGSSSLKFALWQMGAEERELWKGAAEALGSADARLWLVRSEAGAPRIERRPSLPDVRAAVSAVFALSEELGLEAPQALGHRVVHGGPDHAQPRLVDRALLSQLRQLVPWAPLHLPVALDGLAVTLERFPGLPQVACFDTAFHRSLPEIAQRLPLPRALWDRGVRRYGFHGLSYEYVVAHLAESARGRVVIAHLGNGASLAAVHDGRSIDTSMGFTPTGGIMMSTRTGDLDPGVVLYLRNTAGYDTRSIQQLVERESGLYGVSGLSGDVKQLLARAENPSDPHAARARLALEQFCYGVRKQIGAYAAALGGLDTLVFTGGIGEHAAWVRAEVCRALGFLGVELDEEANARHAEHIGRAGSRCDVRVVATDEARMLARHTRTLLRGA